MNADNPALRELLQLIAGCGVYHVGVDRTSGTESVRVDFEDADRIARFTAWDDRSCMLEILCVCSGQYIINERCELTHGAGFKDAFDRFHLLLNP